MPQAKLARGMMKNRKIVLVRALRRWRSAEAAASCERTFTSVFFQNRNFSKIISENNYNNIKTKNANFRLQKDK